MYLAKDILIQVLSEAVDKGKSLGKTRLVKFLYLTEVEYYREIGERLTELRWLFYHYGPYALELEDILAEPKFKRSEFKTEDDRDVILFRVAEPMPSYARRVDVKVSLLVKKIVGRWIDKTLAELLDFVYFETEPMQTAERRGELLDFSTVKKETQTVVIPLTASKETRRKVDELRKRIGPTLRRLVEQRNSPREEGKEYQAAMETWEEDMSKEFDPETLK
ncbi:MAG: DUF4065 domain-containing protein, partial [Ignavibacteriae bacterium]|nr:DUF4065 domain-containing protein [Ignavibacteriota bacterium]